MALTLRDIADNPARLAEATADEVACLYGAIEAMRARLIARLPNAGGLQVSAQPPAPEYLTLKDLANYCAIGTRRLRDHLTDPGHPLPASGALTSTASCVRSSRRLSIDRTPRSSARSLLERLEVERHEAMEQFEVLDVASYDRGADLACGEGNERVVPEARHLGPK